MWPSSPFMAIMVSSRTWALSLLSQLLIILGNLRCSFFVSTQIIINLFIASLNEQVSFKDKRTRIGNLYPQTASISNRQAGGWSSAGVRQLHYKSTSATSTCPTVSSSETETETTCEPKDRPICRQLGPWHGTKRSGRRRGIVERGRTVQKDSILRA
jgi:hypothetical protein